MKTKLLKAAGLTAAFVILGSAYIARVRAQQSTTKSGVPPATTNWTGYLVVGQNDSADPIAVGGPYPTVSRHVEIGLRSDGVVVWRNASKAK
jgi:hypothetical protein